MMCLRCFLFVLGWLVSFCRRGRCIMSVLPTQFRGKENHTQYPPKNGSTTDDDSRLLERIAFSAIGWTFREFTILFTIPVVCFYCCCTQKIKRERAPHTAVLFIDHQFNGKCVFLTVLCCACANIVSAKYERMSRTFKDAVETPTRISSYILRYKYLRKNKTIRS